MSSMQAAFLPYPSLSSHKGMKVDVWLSMFKDRWRSRLSSELFETSCCFLWSAITRFLKISSGLLTSNFYYSSYLSGKGMKDKMLLLLNFDRWRSMFCSEFESMQNRLLL